MELEQFMELKKILEKQFEVTSQTFQVVEFALEELRTRMDNLEKKYNALDACSSRIWTEYLISGNPHPAKKPRLENITEKPSDFDLACTSR
jgi:hypothetical protein